MGDLFYKCEDCNLFVEVDVVREKRGCPECGAQIDFSPPSAKQLAFAEGLGIERPEKQSSPELARAIDRAKEKKRREDIAGAQELARLRGDVLTLENADVDHLLFALAKLWPSLVIFFGNPVDSKNELFVATTFAKADIERVFQYHAFYFNTGQIKTIHFNQPALATAGDHNF